MTNDNTYQHIHVWVPSCCSVNPSSWHTVLDMFSNKVRCKQLFKGPINTNKTINGSLKFRGGKKKSEDIPLYLPYLITFRSQRNAPFRLHPPLLSLQRHNLGGRSDGINFAICWRILLPPPHPSEIWDSAICSVSVLYLGSDFTIFVF